MDAKSDQDSLKRKHFRKLHERIQNKYNEMKLKLDKSRSMESLSTLHDEYDYKQTRYSVIDIVSEETGDTKIIERSNSIIHNLVEETVDAVHQEAKLTKVDSREGFCVYDYTSDTPDLKTNNNDNDNQFFPSDFQYELLNKTVGEIPEDPLSPTPSPRLSIRDRISSRISAAKEKRQREEKEKSANKDKKKESLEKVEKYFLSNTTKQDVIKKKQKSATVTIALIETTGAELESVSDEKRIFSCRFRLGSEKRKSKPVKNSAAVINWQELFNLNMYEEYMLEMSLWEKDTFIGRTVTDLSELEKEKTHKLKLNLSDGVARNVQIFVLLTISGTMSTNTFMDLGDYKQTQMKLDNIARKYAWYRLGDSFSNIGWLTIIVYGAKGLSANECYCVLEIGNERLQTVTDYKTCDPNWMKIFNFAIPDVTNILEVTVYDEKKHDEVGKVLIPLLKINNDEKKWYALKDATVKEPAKGNNPRILLEMRFTWNLIKASVRVINPKEVKYLELEPKLERHILTHNWSRLKAVLTWTYDAFKVIKTCFEWESRKSNVVALVIWLKFCFFFKVWMLPLLFLIPFIWYRKDEYVLLPWKKYLIPECDNKQEEEKEEKISLRQKLVSLQELIQTVQNEIGFLASLGESIKNLFNFTIPFLSLLAIFLICVIAFVMYLIPTQYIFMFWGIHKFTRKILRPNRVPNNEILDLLSRVPDDETLNKCEQLPLQDVSDEDDI